MSENKVIKIRTKNGTQNVNVDLTQDFDYLEVLSLKILQKDAYRLFCSNYGVLVGKVLANGGFPIQNAKLSIFIPLDEEDAQNEEVTSIYPFTTPTSTLVTGKRYNLLPRDTQYNTPVSHTAVGTFPSKYDIMTNQTLEYVHEKYYKYTTTTNANGDYMFFGVPSGTHIIHMDIDLSDIGTNSVSPADLINLGYSPYLFESNTKFRNSNDLDQLAQIVGQNQTTFINPFWGDPDQCNFGITRLDFTTSRFVYPKGYLIGNIYTDDKSSNPNSFIPMHCWQKDQNQATTPEGFKAGVSRVVSANSLRSPKEVAEDGETFGHKGIIEAVRINEDTKLPEYVGKWETDSEGNFLIPLPLNRGKKKWDENEQSWVNSDDDGFFTYADYRFKIYFEGQGDHNQSGFPEYQLDGYTDSEIVTDPITNTAVIEYDHTYADQAKTNRGVIFAPNPRLWDGDQGGDGNNYAFWARPVWQAENGYQYNMEDQFGNQIDVFRNYARIRLGSYYSTEQFFILKSDFDSAFRGYDGSPNNPNGATGEWYNGVDDYVYGSCDNCYGSVPDFKYWSIGTNPWIITRAYIPPNQGKNQFPINYLFTSPYKMKAPTLQTVMTDVSAALHGGFVSKYVNEPKVEAVFGPAFGEINTTGPSDYAFSPSPNWTANAGGFRDNGGTNALDSTPCGDCCDNADGAAGGTVVDWGTGLNMTGTANDAFSQAGYAQCGGGDDDGCIATNTFKNAAREGLFNEDTGPYDYNFQTPGSDSWSDNQVVDPNNGLNGNAGYGGFIAPRAGAYKVRAKVAYCGAADCYWASVGFSICDTTSVDCSNNNNWSYSGRTTVMGTTDCNRADPCYLNFDNSDPYPFNNTQFNKGSGVSTAEKQAGEMSWTLPMKEGQAIKLHVRASASSGPNWNSNANNASDLVVIHWSYNTDGGYHTSLEVEDFNSYNSKPLTTNRDTNQGIVGSLYFPQYYMGADENKSCSRANGDWVTATEPTAKARQYSWKFHSLLVTGSWTEGGNYRETLVEDWGNDPKGGTPIPNSKYYNVNTIGATDIVELTKDIPDFKKGPNQWATLDPLLPETSADISGEMFDLNEKDYEDFSTNAGNPGAGRYFLQKKNFAPYDNLGFRNSQQFPRELGALNWNNTLGNGNLIPAWAEWWSNWGANEFQYPVQSPYYYIQNNFSESNSHYFRYSPANLGESADWKPWATQMPPLWYDNNTFWWKDIYPIEHTGIGAAFLNPTITPNGPQNNPWMQGSTFDVQRGGDTPVVNAYPRRKYYFFGLRPKRTAITRMKDILGS